MLTDGHSFKVLIPNHLGLFYQTEAFLGGVSYTVFNCGFQRHSRAVIWKPMYAQETNTSVPLVVEGKGEIGKLASSLERFDTLPTLFSPASGLKMVLWLHAVSS